jgi:hypothetical protein
MLTKAVDFSLQKGFFHDSHNFIESLWAKPDETIYKMGTVRESFYHLGDIDNPMLHLTFGLDSL